MLHCYRGGHYESCEPMEFKMRYAVKWCRVEPIVDLISQDMITGNLLDVAGTAILITTCSTSSGGTKGELTQIKKPQCPNPLLAVPVPVRFCQFCSRLSPGY